MEVPITRLQIFVLAYLYSKELEWKNDPVRSKITKNRPYLNVNTLARILPSSIVDDDFTETDMIKQLSVLKNKDYIEVSMIGTSSEQFGSFSVTTNGILLVKKIFGKLQNSNKDKKSYEKTIDSLDGNSNIKNWLKGIWDSLKDKAQDEIAEMILSQVKVFGTPLIVLAIDLVRHAS